MGRGLSGKNSVVRVSSFDIFRIRGKGLFGCGRPYCLVQSISDFSKLMVFRTDKGGLSQCGQVGEEGQFFCDFVRTSFMDCPYKSALVVTIRIFFLYFKG